jgi:hypothetical protein
MVWLDSMNGGISSKSYGASGSLGFFGANDQPLSHGQNHESDAEQEEP